MNHKNKWNYIINNCIDYDWLADNIELSDLGCSLSDWLDLATSDVDSENAYQLVDIYELSGQGYEY